MTGPRWPASNPQHPAPSVSTWGVAARHPAETRVAVRGWGGAEGPPVSSCAWRAAAQLLQGWMGWDGIFYALSDHLCSLPSAPALSKVPDHDWAACRPPATPASLDSTHNRQEAETAYNQGAASRSQANFLARGVPLEGGANNSRQLEDWQPSTQEG